MLDCSGSGHDSTLKGVMLGANFLPIPSPASYTLSMNEPRARVLIPRRLSATNARPVWVRLLREVAEQGLPLEITRRHKPSLLLVRASDFEAALGRSHPWSELRARLSPGSFHPNGLQPGVTHRWQHASSNWIRDHFCSVLESVDTTGHPLLVTRRGLCGLMLLARRIFETHWGGAAVGAQDGVSEDAGGRLS
jgi:hypothetical protein